MRAVTQLGAPHEGRPTGKINHDMLDFQAARPSIYPTLPIHKREPRGVPADAVLTECCQALSTHRNTARCVRVSQHYGRGG